MKLEISNRYDKFELLEFNRDVKKTKHLEESMKKHGFLMAHPIVVVADGNKYRIKAGHHRFTVACKLGLPFSFIVSDDTATIYELERATTVWGSLDYLTSYVRQGLPDYITIKNLVDDSGIAVNALAAMLNGECAGSNNINFVFKNGDFKVKDTSHAEEVIKIVKLLKEVGSDWASTVTSVHAISRVLITGKIDSDRLKAKLRAYSAHLKKQRGIDNYMKQLEVAYNWRTQDKIPLVWITDMEMRNRSAINLAKN